MSVVWIDPRDVGPLFRLSQCTRALRRTLGVRLLFYLSVGTKGWRCGLCPGSTCPPRHGRSCAVGTPVERRVLCFFLGPARTRKFPTDGKNDAVILAPTPSACHEGRLSVLPQDGSHPDTDLSPRNVSLVQVYSGGPTGVGSSWSQECFPL